MRARGFAFDFYISLVSQADTKLFQSNPTLATGDVKVVKDGGTPANITTLPTAVSSGKMVKVPISATEADCKNLTVHFSDASGAEWCDATFDFDLEAPGIYVGTAQGGGANYVDLGTDASSTNDFYKNKLVHIVGGTGKGQAQWVETYTGSSRRCQVRTNWITNPDSTSRVIVYASDMLLQTAPTAAEIADANWDEARSGHTTSGTYGETLAMLGNAATAMAVGTVTNTALSPTTTQFELSDVTDATASHWLNRTVLNLSSTRKGQYGGKITAYALTSGRGRFEVEGFTTAPSNGDSILIV